VYGRRTPAVKLRAAHVRPLPGVATLIFILLFFSATCKHLIKFEKTAQFPQIVTRFAMAT
ncbi:hypothetical protein, partial [Gemmiger formicilis]|uniref:hypothetical protein n=1 Tax=Gemmiger formicilis TaxID=745368 RepID=UPI002942A240